VISFSRSCHLKYASSNQLATIQHVKFNEELVQDVISRLRSRQRSSRPDQDSMTTTPVIMPPPLIGGALSDAFFLTSDVCLSRTSGLSREQRGLRRPKLAQRYPTSHVTRTPLSRSKGQRSRSQGRFAGASGGCSGERENVLAVENCCYVAVCSAAQSASAPTDGGVGRGHTVAAAGLQLVIKRV